MLMCCRSVALDERLMRDGMGRVLVGQRPLMRGQVLMRCVRMRWVVR